MITVLGLGHFATLLSMYDFEGRRAMAVYIANNVVDNETSIATAEQTEVVLGLLAPLIQGKLSDMCMYLKFMNTEIAREFFV